MSVDYGTKVVRGWRVPAEITNCINELTDYKYEDCFYRCNAYSDYDEYRYFGKRMYDIECGDAVSLSEIIYESVRQSIIDELDWDAIRQEVASDIECYEALESEPNIWVLSYVS